MTQVGRWRSRNTYPPAHREGRVEIRQRPAAWFGHHRAPLRLHRSLPLTEPFRTTDDLNGIIRRTAVVQPYLVTGIFSEAIRMKNFSAKVAEQTLTATDAAEFKALMDENTQFEGELLVLRIVRERLPTPK